MKCLALVYWIVLFAVAGQFDYNEEIECETQSELQSNLQPTGFSSQQSAWK